MKKTRHVNRSVKIRHRTGLKHDVNLKMKHSRFRLNRLKGFKKVIGLGTRMNRLTQDHQSEEDVDIGIKACRDFKKTASRTIKGVVITGRVANRCMIQPIRRMRQRQRLKPSHHHRTIHLNRQLKLRKKTNIRIRSTKGKQGIHTHSSARLKSVKAVKKVLNQASRLNRKVADKDINENTDLGAYALEKTVQKTAQTVHRTEQSVRVVNKYMVKPLKRLHQRQKGTKTVKVTRKALKSKHLARLSRKQAVKQGIKRIVSPQKFIEKQLRLAMQKLVISNPIVLVALLVGFIFLTLLTAVSGSEECTTAYYTSFMAEKKTIAQYKNYVQELNADFQQQVSNMKQQYSDRYRFEEMYEGEQPESSWVEILAVIAVRYEQQFDFSEEQKHYMAYVFHEMNAININENNQIISIYSHSVEDIFDRISFNDEEQEWARTLIMMAQKDSNLTSMIESLNSGTLSEEERAHFIKNLNGNIDKARQEIILTALKLEGKVPYFWGGKSVAGWNPEWNNQKVVSAPGNPTTDTSQPYGLDCSGFIDWVYKTAELGECFSGGTSQQWNKTTAITFDELLPGDLVFKSFPGQSGVNHVGIFIGKDQNGNNKYIHSQSGQGVVINSYKGFKYPRRPLLFVN